MGVIYGLLCVLNITDAIKICNNTYKNGLSHYFFKKTVYFRQRKNLKDKKNFLLNDGAIKNNVDVIILIT